MAVVTIETNRTNITPKAFWNHVNKLLDKHNIGMWFDNFDSWANPCEQCNSRCKHEDWENPQYEICKSLPFEHHYFLEGAYNFIMEFEYYDDKRGHGYFFLKDMQD